MRKTHRGFEERPLTAPGSTSADGERSAHGYGWRTRRRLCVRLRSRLGRRLQLAARRTAHSRTAAE